MSASERVFYSSENGDRWVLSDNNGTLSVRTNECCLRWHEPNV